MSAVVIHTPQSDAANCTVKNSPACESFRDHREINSGKIGPMITVGTPVSTNPANSKASKPVRFRCWRWGWQCGGMDEVILKERRPAGNFRGCSHASYARTLHNSGLRLADL